MVSESRGPKVTLQRSATSASCTLKGEAGRRAKLRRCSGIVKPRTKVTSDQGYADAQLSLGFIYETGRGGVTQSYSEAA